jgi:hypothetical protein
VTNDFAMVEVTHVFVESEELKGAMRGVVGAPIIWRAFLVVRLPTGSELDQKVCDQYLILHAGDAPAHLNERRAPPDHSLVDQ